MVQREYPPPTFWETDYQAPYIHGRFYWNFSISNFFNEILLFLTIRLSRISTQQFRHDLLPFRYGYKFGMSLTCTNKAFRHLETLLKTHKTLFIHGQKLQQANRQKIKNSHTEVEQS